ncbi:MAG: hypothetical protein H0U94_02750 [Acidobacteria bacterium]|nr:hypothetical protein [Acidobacteriota bacterium]
MARSKFVGGVGVGVVMAGIALAMSGGGAVGQAQVPAEPSEVLSVAIAQVKPAAWSQFIDMQRDETVPMLRKAGTPWRMVWASGVFAEGFTAVSVTPVPKMAQYDQPGPAIRALGEERARAFTEKAREMVSEVRTSMIRTRPDLSFRTAPDATPKLAVVATISVVPGRTADFEAVIKSDVIPAMKKAGVQTYSVSQTVLGGNVNEYTTLTYLDNYAAMDQPWGLEKALGQEGMLALGKKFSGIIEHHERMVVRFMPELSFQAGAPQGSR